MQKIHALILVSLLTVGSVLVGCRSNHAANQPLTKKTYVTTKQVIQYAEAIAPEFYDYNYKNYHSKTESLKPSFTAEGWRDFQDLLNQKSNLATIIQNKWSLHGSLKKGETEVVRQDFMTALPVWELRIPMTVTYYKINMSLHQKIILHMVVIQTSNQQTVQGLRVAAVQAKPLIVSQKPIARKSA